MARARKVIEGLQILQRNEHVEDSINFQAEHDIIYAGPPTNKGFSDEDLAKLEELGWHWDGDLPSWYKYV